MQKVGGIIVALFLVPGLWMGCLPAQQRCESTQDCVSGQLCGGGVCLECKEDRDCLRQETCAGGRCVARPNTLCVAGDRKCEGDTLKVCRQDGASWVSIPCGKLHVCKSAQCIEKPVAKSCGNKVVEAGEQCDDGNQKSGDGCSRHCLKEEVSVLEATHRTPEMEGSPFVLGSRFCRSKSNREKYKTATGPLYVSVSPVICKLDGKPVLTLDQVKGHLAFLNEVYKGARLVFVMAEVRWETDPDTCEVFYDTESSQTLRKYSKQKSISVFYARNIFGGSFAIGGYANLSGVVMNASSFGQKNILAHELGHSLGLDHPHACYHGKETASKCGSSGDELCDTPADPGPAGVNGLDRCQDGTTKNGACTVTRCEKVECPGGETPQIDNLMSYYHCGSALTKEQNLVVRCVAENDQAERVSKKKPCSADEQCENGSCVRGFCSDAAPPCQSNQECGGGKICQLGVCIACTTDGQVVTDKALCCGGERDSIGRCCTGTGCCLTAQHAFVDSNGTCQCLEGFERVAPGEPADVRCKKKAATCTTEGKPASNDAQCCSLERNDIGVCCRGMACCGDQNHSSTGPDGKCHCKDGFEWVTTNNPTDFRCRAKQVTCKQDGEQGAATECCSKESDDGGLCCTGNGCCRAQQNAARGSDGKCQCKVGFERVTPGDASDLRCKASTTCTQCCTALATFKGRTLFGNRDGHRDIISNLAFRFDGKILASASWDQTIKLWDVQAQKFIGTLSGHRNGVTDLAFTADGSGLISAGYDKTVRRWDVANARLLSTTTYFSPFRSLALRPDGAQLAMGSQDSFYLEDLALGKTNSPASSIYVRSIDYAPDSKRFAIGTKTRSVQIWDAITQKIIASLSGHSGLVYRVRFSPDGKSLVTATASEIMVWNAKTLTLLHKIPTSGTLTLSFQPGSTRFASGDTSNRIVIWDATSGKALQTLTGHSQDVYALQFSPSGKILASGAKDNAVRLWTCQ